MKTSIVKYYYQDDQVAQSYDQERFTSLSGRVFNHLEQRAIAKLLWRAISTPPLVPRPRVLDAPCGTGRITELLLDLGPGLEVTGGDISTAMMRRAQSRCEPFGERVRFEQIDLDHLALPDNSFDLVTCIRLFHHLESAGRIAVLTELARVTRRHVVVNLSLATPYLRARRWVKRQLGQGTCQQSASWTGLRREIAVAGLRLEASLLVAPLVSEDLVLLLTKPTPPEAA